MKMTFVTIFLTILFLLPIKGYALCESCDNNNFLNVLEKLESGGQGYSAQSGVIEDPDSSHTGATAMGKWQIMHREAVSWGCIPSRSPSEAVGATDYVLEDWEVQAFLNNPTIQDTCKVTGLEEKYNTLVNLGYENGAAGYDCGALLGAAWLGSPKSVVEGTCTGDSINKSYTTCTRASQMQGVCAGGDANETDIAYPGRAAVLIGCDTAILEKGQVITDALVQNAFALAAENVQQPPSSDVMTCAEQRLAAYGDVSKSFSQPDGGGTTFLADLQTSFSEKIGSSFDSIVPNSATETAAKAYSNSVSASTSSGTSNCTAIDEFWALTGCEPFGGASSLNDIIADQLSKITGALDDLTDFPSRLHDAVCSAAEDVYGDIMGDVDDFANDTVSAYTDPVTDRLYDINDNVDNAIGNTEEAILGTY